MKVLRLTRRIIAILFISCFVFKHAYADTLHIASASNFKPVLEQLITHFSKNTGHKVHASYGSSGKIFLQIQHGAPYDLFLSADAHKPSLLVRSGYAKEAFKRTYAIGRLALWSNKRGTQLQDGKFLHTKKLTRLALADKKLAPYGLASEEVLKNLSAMRSTRQRWVIAHSAIQAFHFVSSGNVDAGFVPISHLISQGIPFDEQVWPVPNSLHSPVLQDMVLLTKAEDNPIAIQFWSFILSKNAKELISSYGYDIAE